MSQITLFSGKFLKFRKSAGEKVLTNIMTAGFASSLIFSMIIASYVGGLYLTPPADPSTALLISL